MKKKIIIKIFLIALIILLTSATTVYAVLSIESSNVSYDNTTTGLPNTVQGAIDNLYTRQEVEMDEWKNKYLAAIQNPSNIKLIDYIRALPTDNENIIQKDETADQNMRYIGANPSNYITFNNETAGWRIIGVFNSNSHGMDEDLVKIVKNSNIGYSQWNSSGTNDWTNSSLKDYLNTGVYYTTSLEDTSKNMIQNVEWKIGGSPNDQSQRKADIMYRGERGSVGATSVPNTVKWSTPGYIALPYASDFIYATSGNSESNVDRDTCLKTSTYFSSNSYWNSSNGLCFYKSWMFIQDNGSRWTLTPVSVGNIANVFYTTISNSAGAFGASGNTVKTSLSIYPTLYLKSSVICTNCNEADVGTSTNPFELSYTEE